MQDSKRTNLSITFFSNIHSKNSSIKTGNVGIGVTNIPQSLLEEVQPTTESKISTSNQVDSQITTLEKYEALKEKTFVPDFLKPSESNLALIKEAKELLDIVYPTNNEDNQKYRERYDKYLAKVESHLLTIKAIENINNLISYLKSKQPSLRPT